MTAEPKYSLRVQELVDTALSDTLHKLDAYTLTALIHLYYDGEMGTEGERSTGGNLHITLDDGNVSGGNVLFCLRQAEREGDVLGVLIAEALLDYSADERERIVNGQYQVEGH